MYLCRWFIGILTEDSLELEIPTLVDFGILLEYLVQLDWSVIFLYSTK
jgi:hypothetical protein